MDPRTGQSPPHQEQKKLKSSTNLRCSTSRKQGLRIKKPSMLEFRFKPASDPYTSDTWSQKSSNPWLVFPYCKQKWLCCKLPCSQTRKQRPSLWCRKSWRPNTWSKAMLRQRGRAPEMFTRISSELIRPDCQGHYLGPRWWLPDQTLPFDSYPLTPILWLARLVSICFWSKCPVLES